MKRTVKIILVSLVLHFSANAQGVQNIKVRKAVSDSGMVGKWNCWDIRIPGQMSYMQFGNVYEFFGSGYYILGGRESGRWELINKGKTLRLYKRNITNADLNNINYLGDSQEVSFTAGDEFLAKRQIKGAEISYTFWKESRFKKRKTMPVK
jgi:hypothetical protein